MVSVAIVLAAHAVAPEPTAAAPRSIECMLLTPDWRAADASR
jgi:hypothetical protein